MKVYQLEASGPSKFFDGYCSRVSRRVFAKKCDAKAYEAKFLDTCITTSNPGGPDHLDCIDSKSGIKLSILELYVAGLGV